jgi:hypothetical protein
MKTIKIFFFVLLVATYFSSCQSTRSVQLLLNKQYSELDYELISTVFEGKRDKTVYLNSIDDSKMELYNKVTKSKSLVLPFLLLNYWHKKFTVVLGEHALTQVYREFFTDALLVECNRSACFTLKTNEEALHSDVYTLDVDIIRNKTQSGIQETNIVFIFPSLFLDDFDLIHTNYHVLPTSSDLEISVFLKKGSLVLFEKHFSTQQYFKYKSYGDFVSTTEKCVYKMSQCLAQSTELLVTDICRELNLILSGK